MEEHERCYLHWDCLTVAVRVMLTASLAVFVMWSGISNFVLNHVIIALMALGEYL